MPTIMDRSTCEQAVLRVANSKTFRHRGMLRHLLVYLAGKTSSDQSADLKEYVIGVEAFSKPPGYDPQADASVRVQVSRLRHCLSEYYEDEGSEDAVRIEIPKGQFRLEFNAHEQTDRDEKAASQDEFLRRRLGRIRKACAALVCVAVVAIAGMAMLWIRSASLPSLAPELMAIWGNYVTGGRPVLVVLGAPLFAKYTTAETGLFFRDPRLNEWEQAKAAPDIGRVGAAVGGVRVTQSRIYTGVGEATGAFLLGRMMSPSGREISLRRSNGLSLDDYRDRNVIVLGAPKYNAHLKDLPVEQQFLYSAIGIWNLRPQPGEPKRFDQTFSSDYEEVVEDHAVISRFPGLHGVGETTVLGGNSTEGTLAAVEFATQPRYAAELAARLRDGRRQLPKAYQVVIRARFKSQTPVEIRYVTHRVLETTLTAGFDSPTK